MMTYARIQSGEVAQYPYSARWLRTHHPDVSFPKAPSDELLAEYGVFPVTLVPQPTVALDKNAVEGIPALVNGVWTQVWDVVNADAGDIAARQQALVDRDARLAILADSFVPTFIAMTPAQVSAYIGTNVTNLATAKTVIEKLALMILLLSRREFG